MRLIKKYKNRRLYDTQRSQYITIEELQRYVLDGIEFKIVDSTNGKNITNATLLQIIVEIENTTTEFFSEDFLKQLIIFANSPIHQFYKNMIEQTFSTLKNISEVNPYYQNKSSAWNENFQQAIEQWQNFLKK